MFKAIWEKLLIGAGGAIAAAIILYLSSWGTSSTPTVEVSWVTAPVPRMDTLALEEMKRQGPMLERLFKTNAIPEVIDALRYQREALILQAKISNKSAQVFKQIEVSIKDQLVSLMHHTNGSERFVSSGRAEPVVIPLLNPGDSVDVVFLAKQTYFSGEPPIRILYDGRLVAVRQQTIDRDVIGLTSFFVRNELLLFLLVLVLAFYILMTLWLIFALANQNNFELLTKLYSRSDLARTVKFADYLRTEQRHLLPDKLKDVPTPEKKDEKTT